MKHRADQLEALRARQTQANLVFQPLFYRLQNEKDRQHFDELLTSPGIILVDQIWEQLRELMKFKNPSVRFSTNELESETKKYLGDKNLEEFGVWIYYPWSNRLVHTLDEEDFINIRTSRNQYKITREERDRLAQKKIGVIGLSVGQSVSVTVAMERICGELRLADFDTLELNNLNRIRAGIHNLGLPKVYSVAREIAEIDPYLKVICFPQGLVEENMDTFFTEGGNLDLLIEESDGFDIKILSRYKARALKIPVVMEASDRCMVDVERFDLEPERPILHGIVDHLNVDTLKSLQTNEEKIPYMLDVLGIETSSVRLKASMVEMNQTINTWPQLASAVTMGGGITADVSRRLLLNQYTESGRYHVDIEELIGNKKKMKPEAPALQEPLTATRIKEICAASTGSQRSDATAGQLQDLVEAACLAPSYANKQPWTWASFNNQLFLFTDLVGSNSFIDPMDMGIHTSLGAALENVILKAGELGLEAVVTLAPRNDEQRLIARIHFTKKTGAPEINLGAFINARQTNRKAGTGKPLAPALLSELCLAVQQSADVNLTFAEDREKINAIAQASGIAERIYLLHPKANEACFSKEIRWAKGAEEVREGMDIKTLELPVLAETALQVVSDAAVADLLYTWGKGIAFEKMAAHTINSSSALGMITVSQYAPANIIHAGMAIQRAWLTATKNNLSFQPICVPLYLLGYLNRTGQNLTFSEKIVSELEHIKKEFVNIFPELNSRQGVFLFRLSEAESSTRRSLRKPLNEVYHKL